MTDYTIERDPEYHVIDPETGIESTHDAWVITDGITEWYVTVDDAPTVEDAWDWFADHKIY